MTHRSRYTFKFRCTLALAATMATSAHAAGTDRPDVHLADRWSWQHTNGLVNERDYTLIEDVIDVSDTEIKARERVRGKPGQTIAAFTREWNPVDDGGARYDPYLGLLSFPLETGKKWSATADKLVFAKGKHGQFQLQGEVLGFEKVTVPAGTFDAYKIRLHIDAQSTDEDANIGNTVETVWYAPAAKRYVKREITFSRDGGIRSKDVYDLVDYVLR